MKEFTRVEVGELLVDRDVISITDPSYNKDVWCRINDFKIVPGRYTCMVNVSDEGDWGDRIATLAMYLNGKEPKNLVYIGEIGVDSGSAGFFVDKPDFTRDEWLDWCDLHDHRNQYWLDTDGNAIGFVSTSGFGDGGYGVYACLDRDGNATAVEIHFIEPDDDLLSKTDVEYMLKNGFALSNIFEMTSGNGYTIFKADDFAEDKVIFIPDLSFHGLEGIFDKNGLTEQEIEGVLNLCYTGRDFLDMCDGNEEDAENLFSSVDAFESNNAIRKHINKYM